MVIVTFFMVSQATGISEDVYNTFRHWKWQDANTTHWESFLSNKWAFFMLTSQVPYYTNLNKYWFTSTPSSQWNKRWKLLWSVDLNCKSKIFLRQIINLGLYTTITKHGFLAMQLVTAIYAQGQSKLLIISSSNVDLQF